ncbi:MAG: methylmalonyl Co-A mutase-associated GTPase MeaB [Spirochaetes bacterium]|nr:MAG: methylmalonyl Co-A mutase-associated GTPase MeaB [Spirochaetota bacterium]
MEIVKGIVAGNIRSIARAVSIVENNMEGKEELLDELHTHTGNAVVWGITGPPGAGKSTLADRLIQKERSEGKKVAVIAVDPSSPFTGGSLLGDRLRMQTHATDPGVFIRSMASRGHLGGISTAAFDAVKIFDAAGYDTIMVETIGVGQTEVEIIELSDIVMLVLVPGMGDEIQAMKAGVMEIGDIFVVNKSDREGAERLKAEVEYVLMISEKPKESPQKKICMTSARDNTGIDELHRILQTKHTEDLKSGFLEEKRKHRLNKELSNLFYLKTREFLEEQLSIGAQMDTWIEGIYKKEIKPYKFISEKMKELKKEYVKG